MLVLYHLFIPITNRGGKSGKSCHPRWQKIFPKSYPGRKYLPKFALFWSIFHSVLHMKFLIVLAKNIYVNFIYNWRNQNKKILSMQHHNKDIWFKQKIFSAKWCNIQRRISRLDRKYFLSKIRTCQKIISVKISNIGRKYLLASSDNIWGIIPRVDRKYFLSKIWNCKKIISVNI